MFIVSLQVDDVYTFVFPAHSSEFEKLYQFEVYETKYERVILFLWRHVSKASNLSRSLPNEIIYCY